MPLKSHSYLLFLSILLSTSVVPQLFILCSTLSPDGLSLLAFKAAVSADPSSALADWDETDNDPCLWPGVSCANISGFSYPRVVVLSVPGKGLSGYIPSELGSLVFLRRLNLHSNHLSGPIPPQLSNATSLHSLYLYSNNLSAPFPSTLCNLPRLQNLDLSKNALSGTISPDLGNCRQLQRLLLSGNGFSGVVPSGIWQKMQSLMQLDLSSNNLDGPIPPDLGDLKSLSGTLNLSHNHFSGEIPSGLGNLPTMVTLDLRGNDLSGEIPQVGALSNQGPSTFLGNPRLCGFPLQNPCEGVSPVPSGGQVPVPPTRGDGGTKVHKSRRGLKPELIILVSVGDAAAVAVIGVVLVYTYWKLKDGNHGCSCTGKSKLGGGAPGKIRPCCWKGGGGDGGGSMGSPSSQSEEAGEGEEEADRRGLGNAVGGRLVALDKGFSVELDELLRASAYVLGKSRTGIMYKVVLGSGLAVAVRRLGDGSGAAQLKRKEFAAEVGAMGKVRHPNVVGLRAYYWSPDEKLLVSDFIPNGSLAAALRGRWGQAGLSWAVRLRIARGAARGLAHIHECKIVHGDVKPSNVLLDADFTPYVSDFGLSRLLHVSGGASDAARGSGFLGGSLPYGCSSDRPNCSYRAPEARLPGSRPAQKWDVYSFGVVLLELLTGKSPDQFPSPPQAAAAAAAASSSYSRPPPPPPAASGGDAEELVRWAREGFLGEKPLTELVEPALLWRAQAKGEVAAAFGVALACTESDPESRPRMKTVWDNLDKIGRK